MKRLLIASFVFASFFQTPVLAQDAGRQPEARATTTNDILAFCSEFAAQTGVALGRCVGYLQTEDLGSSGFGTHFCQALQGGDPDAFYQTYDSLSDCVRDVQN